MSLSMAADLASKSSPASGARSSAVSACERANGAQRDRRARARRAKGTVEPVMMAFQMRLGGRANRDMNARPHCFKPITATTSRLSHARAAQERGNRADDIRLAFVARDIRTPRLRAHRGLRLPHDVELAVAANFADHHRLVQMVVAVHRQREARRRGEVLADHRDAHLVDVGALRFLDGLLPHMDADEGRFHRIVRHALVAARQVLRLHPFGEIASRTSCCSGSSPT